MEDYIGHTELHRCLPGAEDGLDNTQCMKNILPYAIGGMLGTYCTRTNSTLDQGKVRGASCEGKLGAAH